MRLLICPSMAVALLASHTDISMAGSADVVPSGWSWHPSVLGLPFGDALGAQGWTMADLTGRRDEGEVPKLAKMSGIHQKVWSEANEKIYKPI